MPNESNSNWEESFFGYAILFIPGFLGDEIGLEISKIFPKVPLLWDYKSSALAYKKYLRVYI